MSISRRGRKEESQKHGAHNRKDKKERGQSKKERIEKSEARKTEKRKVTWARQNRESLESRGKSR